MCAVFYRVFRSEDSFVAFVSSEHRIRVFADYELSYELTSNETKEEEEKINFVLRALN